MMYKSLIGFVKTMSQDPLFGINIAACSVLCIVAIKHILHGGGILRRESIRIKAKMNLVYKLDSYGKKYIRSFRELKFAAGFVCFVQESTFVSVMKFTLDQTINILLAW